MNELNIPRYGLRERIESGSRQLFDIVRRRWVAYTPEEYVRQQFVHYLISERGVPAGLIAVEHAFSFGNGKPQRADVVVFGTDGKAKLLVECKACNVRITPEVFEQASRYNAVFRAPWIVITNGIAHYAFSTSNGIDYRVEDRIPAFREL